MSMFMTKIHRFHENDELHCSARRVYAAVMHFTELWQALRRIRRQPAFAVGVVTVLALAIGANSAMFALVNAILLRPLPFADPDRLVTFTIVRPGNDRQPLSLLDVNDFTAVESHSGRRGVGLRVEREPHGPWRRRAAHRDARVRATTSSSRARRSSSVGLCRHTTSSVRRRSSAMACGSGISAGRSTQSASRSS